MITNQKEIEIEQIHDLKTINLVDLVDDVFTDGHCLLLEVTYGKDETIKYNYTDEYFHLLLDKLIELYTTSTNKDKILLVGENTKKIFKDLENLYQLNKINNNEIPFIQNYPIIENSTKRFDIDIIRNIVNDLGNSLLFLESSTNQCEITNIEGIKNKWIINYSDNGINKFLPIYIYKNGKNYKFRVNMIGNSLFDIDGNINFYDDTISTSWKDNNTGIEGKIDYSLNNLNQQNIIKYNNKIVGLQKNNLQNQESDQKLLYFYMSLYNFKINNYNKGCDNLYFGLSQKDENNYYITQNSTININDDLANIKIKTKKNIKYNENCSFFFENEDLDIILRTFEYNDKKYVLEQINYLPTQSTGEYKYFYENKYNYKLYEINKDENLKTGFTINKTYEINNAITSLSDVYQIIEGVKKYGLI